MAPPRPLRYVDFAWRAFIRPTCEEQKAPLWSCPECERVNNFACRLACFCGYRPGKSHEDKAWHAYRKAQAVPRPNSKPARARPEREETAWDKKRGAKGKGKGKDKEADGEVEKMRAQLARLERDSVPIERLRLAIEASQGLSAQDLLKEVVSQGVADKPRKPPRHEHEAERRKNTAQRKLDKTTETLAGFAAELAALQERIRTAEARLEKETADLELAKQEQNQVRIDQLVSESNNSLVCVAPPELAGDEAFEQARKRFEADVAALQEAKARASQNTGMQDVGQGPPADRPPRGRQPAADVVPQPSSEADLLKAGLEPAMAKRTAEQLAEQYREASENKARERSRTRSRSRG